MRIISNEELLVVGGGDAAATRRPGTNSWGETPDDQAAREASEAADKRDAEERLDALVDFLNG
jgi:hypothetical protein